jgi:hypothetical protein
MTKTRRTLGPSCRAACATVFDKLPLTYPNGKVGFPPNNFNAVPHSLAWHKTISRKLEIQIRFLFSFSKVYVQSNQVSH